LIGTTQSQDPEPETTMKTKRLILRNSNDISIIGCFLTAVFLMTSIMPSLGATKDVDVNKANLAETMKGVIRVDVSREKSGAYIVRLVHDPSKRTAKMVEARHLAVTDAKLTIPSTEKEGELDLWVPLALGPSRGKTKFVLRPQLFRRASVRISTLSGRNTLIYTIDLASFAK